MSDCKKNIITALCILLGYLVYGYFWSSTVDQASFSSRVASDASTTDCAVSKANSHTAFPIDNWSRSCSGFSLDDKFILQANCSDQVCGEHVWTGIDLNKCIGVDDGHLSFMKG